MRPLIVPRTVKLFRFESLINADCIYSNNHHLAQQWAFELWQHLMQVDGIYYRARHDLDQYCAAIFNQTSELWSIQDTQHCTSRAFSATLADILDTYEFGLIN
jgi:hypothetical protein